jgi:hypothetical protein
MSRVNDDAQGVSVKLPKVSPNCPISSYDGNKPTLKNPMGDY